MKLRNAAALAALVIAGLTGISCTQGTLGIFASLQRETKILDRGLDNGLTPVQMVVTGTAPTDNYFLAAGTLYERPRDPGNSVSWTAIAPPAGMHYVNGVAYLSGSPGTLVASFYTSDINNITGAVYHRPADLSSGWVKSNLVTNGSTVQSIGELFLITSDIVDGSDAVYACTRNASANTYELWRSTDGANFGGSPAGPSSQSPFTDGLAYDPGGGDEIDVFLSKSDIVTYDGTTTTTLSNASPTLTDLGGAWYNSSAGLFGGIGLFVTSGNSILKGTFTTGTWSWTTVVSSYPSPTSGDLVFSQITATESTAYNAIIIGTEANGYYLLDANGGTGISTVDPTSNYQASDLRTSAVTMLFVDPDAGAFSSGVAADTDLVFAGGYAKGLWETYYDGDSPTWIQN